MRKYQPQKEKIEIKKQTKSKWCKQFLLVAILGVVIFFSGSLNIVAQGKFNPTDKFRATF